ncbi:hypothetical protein B0H16DRAFT_1702596 [Mycena metata]|uniref:Uncharacterized protein n=1 Tax=Mycena metata TaxID=1033252 RepID=A0AAD7H6A8_9AGAR|nr:hypothetical protein B0H16DRAFT_1702596 [Mycena metata]
MSLGGRIYGRLNAAQIDRKYGRLSPGRYYARLSQYFSVSMSVPWTFASMSMFVQCSFTMTSTFDVQPSSFDSSLLYTQLNQHLDAVERSFNAQENSTSTSASRDGFHPRGFRVEIEFGSDDETWFNANSHTPFLGSRFRRRSIQYPPPFNFLPSLRSPNTFTDQFKHTYPTQVQFNQQVQPMASVRLHLLVGFSTAPAVIPTKLNATHPSYAWNSLSGTATPPEVRSAVNQHLIENSRPRAAPNYIQDLRSEGHGGRYGLGEGEGMDGGDEEGRGEGEGVGAPRTRRVCAKPSLRNSGRAVQRARDSARAHITQVWCRREGHAVRYGLGEGKGMDGGGEEVRERTVREEGDAEPRINETSRPRCAGGCDGERGSGGVSEGGDRRQGRGGVGEGGDEGERGDPTRTYITQLRCPSTSSVLPALDSTVCALVRCGRGTTVYARAGDDEGRVRERGGGWRRGASGNGTLAGAGTGPSRVCAVSGGVRVYRGGRDAGVTRGRGTRARAGRASGIEVQCE